MDKRIGLLIIGNEVLNGKVSDSNTPIAAKKIYECGHQVERVVACPDDVNAISEELNRLRRLCDVIITSGGVGVTHDDVTIAGIALAFGRRVVRSSEGEAIARHIFGPDMPERQLDLANVPEGAELMAESSEHWPIIRIENVFILPGVPELFHRKLELVLQTLPSSAPWISQVIFLNTDEPLIAATLDDIVKAFPDVSIGSYPQWSEPVRRLKITFDGKDKARIAAAMIAFEQRIPADVRLD